MALIQGQSGSGGGTPVTQIAYAEVTATLSVTATTEAGAQTFADSGSQAYTAVQICIECFSPALEAGAVGTTVLNLWDGATNLGILEHLVNPGGSTLRAPCLVRRFLTPTAASHQYIVKAWRQAANGAVNCGTGGIGAFLPGYIRVTSGG